MAKRILIVEDEPTLRFALQDYFDQAGYAVDAAAELAQADELLSGVSYDVVITDLLLTAAREPEGLQVIERVHERDQCSRVVVLTACDNAAVEESAMRLGVDRFFRKPVPLSILARTVSSLVTEMKGRVR